MDSNVYEKVNLIKAVHGITTPGTAYYKWGQTITPDENTSYLTVYVSIGTAAAFGIERTISTTVATEYMNALSNLNADAAYMFTFPATVGESIDFLTGSATAITVNSLYVYEG